MSTRVLLQSGQVKNIVCGLNKNISLLIAAIVYMIIRLWSRNSVFIERCTHAFIVSEDSPLSKRTVLLPARNQVSTHKIQISRLQSSLIAPPLHTHAGEEANRLLLRNGKPWCGGSTRNSKGGTTNNGCCGTIYTDSGILNWLGGQRLAYRNSGSSITTS